MECLEWGVWIGACIPLSFERVPSPSFDYIPVDFKRLPSPSFGFVRCFQPLETFFEENNNNSDRIQRRNLRFLTISLCRIYFSFILLAEPLNR